MFFYLSFLRPPPTQVPLGSGFAITPQVANDLRTELYPHDQDIYYSWCACEAAATTRSSPVAITKPSKLTTWRVGNAYKEVSIQPPQGARDGQMFKLVLTTHAQGFPHIVNLGGKAVGQRPFPVVSMPIMFRARDDPAGIGKQEQVERIYRISTSSEDQVFLAIQEKTSFDLDKKIWDSGIGLSSWLVELIGQKEDLSRSAYATHLRSLLKRRQCNIIELGTGTGVVSIALGALRSIIQGSGAEGAIIATDLDSAMPLLQKNISANERLFRSASARPQAVVLDWDQPNLPVSVSESPGPFNLIVMADVTYNTSSFPSLVNTLDKLLHFGEGRDDYLPSTLLLGYKERDASERTLWEMVNRIGLHLHKIDERLGASEPPVEIWIARPERHS